LPSELLKALAVKEDLLSAFCLVSLIVCGGGFFSIYP